MLRWPFSVPPTVASETLSDPVYVSARVELVSNLSISVALEPLPYVQLLKGNIMNKTIKFISAPLHLKNKELTLVFLDQPQAKKINFAYRKKNYATDILSFSYLS